MTTYTITTHRVLIRMGIALPMTLNLPYAEVETAGLRVRADGSGDIALKLADQGRKLSWFLLWPHARPFRFGKAEPLLRALSDGERAGAILSEALAKSSETPARRVRRSGAEARCCGKCGHAIAVRRCWPPDGVEFHAA